MNKKEKVYIKGAYMVYILFNVLLVRGGKYTIFLMCFWTSLFSKSVLKNTLIIQKSGTSCENKLSEGGKGRKNTRKDLEKSAYNFPH